MSLSVREQNVSVRVGNAEVEGDLTVPAGAEGLVIFVHGSGSSRHSPRNRFVARTLNDGGLATLLFDLLTAEEERVDIVTREYRFNTDLLAGRTLDAREWVSQHPEAGRLPVGYFGASTGAAAALIAAAEGPDRAKAVVSRGGRPDLAGSALERITVPVLLLVGELDTVVIDLNKQALAQMPSRPDKRMEIVPGATHLFEEPGALDRVAEQARDWFLQYLTNVG